MFDLFDLIYTQLYLAFLREIKLDLIVLILYTCFVLFFNYLFFALIFKNILRSNILVSGQVTLLCIINISFVIFKLDSSIKLKVKPLSTTSLKKNVSAHLLNLLQNKLFFLLQKLIFRR